MPDFSLLLREYVRAVMTEKAAPPDGPKSGPFGQYMFADQREDTPGEPNTTEEDRLVSALYDHYHGRPEALQSWIGELVELRKLYPSFLKPPKRNKRAYRMLIVPPSSLSSIVGETEESFFDGEVHYSEGGHHTGEFRGRNFFSWTLEPDVFFGLKSQWNSVFASDWTKRSVGNEGFVVFVYADIDSNEFLLNPDKINKTSLAGKHSYQSEVISVGEVELRGASFFYFDENTSTDEENMLIKRAIDMIEE